MTVTRQGHGQQLTDDQVQALREHHMITGGYALFIHNHPDWPWSPNAYRQAKAIVTWQTRTRRSDGSAW